MLSAIVVEERQTLIGENKHNKSRRLFLVVVALCVQSALTNHTNLISMHPKLIPNFRVNIVDYFHIERIAIISISHAFTSANANGNGNI